MATAIEFLQSTLIDSDKNHRATLTDSARAGCEGRTKLRGFSAGERSDVEARRDRYLRTRL